MPTRLLIVENERLFRDMLRMTLSAREEFDVVGDVGDGQSAILLAQDLEFDVALMDIDLGHGPNGIEAGIEIKESRPEVGIVLLSMLKEKEALASLPRHVSNGWSYLLKQSVANVEALSRAIDGAAAGLMMVDPELTRMLVPRVGGALAGLTPRQTSVIELMAQGYNNSAIAAQLSVSEKSVENYVNAVYQQLQVRADDAMHPRVQAVLAFLRESDGRDPGAA
jgi:DNA-binding NarL/FixJ family response regulator